MSANVWWMIGFYIMGSLTIILTSNLNLVRTNNKIKLLQKENDELKETVGTLTTAVQHIAKDLAIQHIAKDLAMKALRSIADDFEQSLKLEEEKK